MTNLYCNRPQFVLWVHVEQTETSSHMQRLTIIHPGGQSIHLLVVTEEYIAFLCGKEWWKKEVWQRNNKTKAKLRRKD